MFAFWILESLESVGFKLGENHITLLSIINFFLFIALFFGLFWVFCEQKYGPRQKFLDREQFSVQSRPNHTQTEISRISYLFYINNPKAYRNRSAVEFRVQIGNHPFFISCDFQNQIKELLAPMGWGKVHLEVIWMNVQEETTIISLVVSKERNY